MKPKIPKPDLTVRSEKEYWDTHAKISKKNLYDRLEPCSNCPVIEGMYREFSDKLKKQEPNLRYEAARKWFCHSDPNTICKGNWDNCFGEGDYQ